MTITQTSFSPTYDRVLKSKRIVSWWDMLQIDTRNFLSSLTLISSALGEYQILLTLTSQSQNLLPSQPVETRAIVLKALQTLQDECALHGLKTSETIAQSAFRACADALAGEYWFHPNNLRSVTTALESLIKVIVTEAEGRQFYVLDGTVSEQHDDADALFGAEVVDAFPHAAFDIAEAGKCLSFGLSTACVMHTMRVIECGLDALATHVGVPKSDNWNKTLNAVEAALRTVNKTADGADAAQLAAEAGTHLRFIKNAWRNQAMHSTSKYDKREAKAIFENARSFMAHMAKMTTPDRDDGV